MPSANLGVPYVAAAQNQKEVTINSGFDAVDAALTEVLAISLAAGDVTVTAAQATRNQVLRCSGNTVARNLNLPQLKRELVIVNQGTAVLSVKRGTTTVAMPAGAPRRVYMDGTANGLIETGGSGGIAEAPTDGKLYARQSGAWAQVPAAPTYTPGTGLGLTGTQFNITDPELIALLGLNSAADTVPLFTGPGTATLMTVTAVARTVLDDTTTAAMLATLGALPASGGTMDGNLVQPSGFYVMGATARFQTRSNTNGIAPNFQVLSTGANASMMIGRFSPDAFQGRFAWVKSRGTTVGAHGACLAGDASGEFTFGWSNGSYICEGARIIVAAEEAPGTNYTPARFAFWTSGPGGTPPAERLAVNATGDLQMGGINTVIGGNRHLRLRSYTVATLPVGTAADMIYVSNGTSNRRLAVYDGTNWCWADGTVVS